MPPTPERLPVWERIRAWFRFTRLYSIAAVAVIIGVTIAVFWVRNLPVKGVTLFDSTGDNNRRDRWEGLRETESGARELIIGSPGLVTWQFDKRESIRTLWFDVSLHKDQPRVSWVTQEPEDVSNGDLSKKVFTLEFPRTTDQDAHLKLPQSMQIMSSNQVAGDAMAFPSAIDDELLSVFAEIESGSSCVISYTFQLTPPAVRPKDPEDVKTYEKLLSHSVEWKNARSSQPCFAEPRVGFLGEQGNSLRILLVRINDPGKRFKAPKQ